MKVNKLNQLFINERIIKSTNPHVEETLEVVNRSINTEDFQLHFQNDIPYRLLVKILGKPFSREHDESMWNCLVHEDGFKRPCLFNYLHNTNTLETWARNENTALNARRILMDIKVSDSISQERELPKSVKPKVDIE